MAFNVSIKTCVIQQSLLFILTLLFPRSGTPYIEVLILCNSNCHAQGYKVFRITISQHYQLVQSRRHIHNIRDMEITAGCGLMQYFTKS